MNDLLHSFHFLRPLWFLALLPVTGLFWLLLKQHFYNRSWQQVIDPALLPYLLGQEQQPSKRWPAIAFLISGLCIITALAGPVWEQLEQPVFRKQSSLVVLLDLSRSMNATDIKPSRIARAHLKLRDILNQRKEGDTALIVYAAHAFVVTPLTEDTHTITSQLSSLDNELMPSQGSRADRAIAQAIALLQQASIQRGSILLITDGIESADNPELDEQLRELRRRGHQLLILGVGSQQGAPIPLANGGFFKDDQGNIVIPGMDATILSRISQQGNGRFHHITANEEDVHALINDMNRHQQQENEQQEDHIKSDQWQERGPWLLIPVLLLSLLIFRRGYLLLFIFLGTTLPEPAQAVDWDKLWSRDDQIAAKLLTSGDYKAAAQRFQSTQWRAHAHYQAGDYEQSLKTLNSLDTAKDHYNRGNSLAQLERIPEAIQAYEEALNKQPDMPDALHNRDLLKDWLQQQQDKEKSQGDGKGSDEKEEASRQDQQGNPDKESKSDGEENETDKADTQDSQTNNNQGNGEQTPSSQQEKNKGDNEEQEQALNQAADSNQQDESQQATEQWLRRIPDDPGGLWRRKFLYQYQRQQQQGDEQHSW